MMATMGARQVCAGCETELLTRESREAGRCVTCRDRREIRRRLRGNHEACPILRDVMDHC